MGWVDLDANASRINRRNIYSVRGRISIGPPMENFRACWALLLFLKFVEVERSFANNFRVCAQSENKNKKEVGKVMSTSLRHVPQVKDLRLYLGRLHDCS